jgi:hypothetical protein
MTPTLSGRWQSRFFLLATVGLFVTIPFALLFSSLVPFIILGLVFGFGLGWDVLYSRWQKRRWDHDWPPNLQLAAGIVEGLFVFGLLYGWLRSNALPPASIFWLHYALVWLTTFSASQSLMRLYFPRWRYRGGEWL